MPQWLDDLVIKNWTWIMSMMVIPVVGFIRAKLKEQDRLTVEVEQLKKQMDGMEKKFDGRFDEFYERQDRKDEKLWQHLQQINSTLMEVKQDTAVNKTRLEERR